MFVCWILSYQDLQIVALSGLIISILFCCRITYSILACFIWSINMVKSHTHYFATYKLLASSTAYLCRYSSILQQCYYLSTKVIYMLQQCYYPSTQVFFKLWQSFYLSTSEYQKQLISKLTSYSISLFYYIDSYISLYHLFFSLF